MKKLFEFTIIAVLFLNSACNAPLPASTPAPQAASTDTPFSSPHNDTTENLISTPSSAVTTIIPVTGHLMRPAEDAPEPGKMFDDVESSGTGPEGRAPYGDSYKINRFERPFLQDMTYSPDMDIHRFGISEDEDWYYVSILLIGDNPNGAQEIHYGVEIDPNADGFGEYILWAHPPYSNQWGTTNVRMFEDTNQDSGVVSADAGFSGDGYDTLIFDGASAQNTDHDLAWVRWIDGEHAVVQFAFKKSWIGSVFMLGVVADAGLRDVTRYDYNNYMTIAEAGSPVRNHANFPLGSLYAVDNTCWVPFGLQSVRLSPKSCQPIILEEAPAPSAEETGVEPSCTPPADPYYCVFGWNPAICDCDGPPDE